MLRPGHLLGCRKGEDMKSIHISVLSTIIQQGQAVSPRLEDLSGRREIAISTALPLSGGEEGLSPCTLILLPCCMAPGKEGGVGRGPLCY